MKKLHGKCQTKRHCTSTNWSFDYYFQPTYLEITVPLKLSRIFRSSSRLFAAGALTPRWLPPQLRDHAFVKDTNLLSSPHSRTFSGQKSPSSRWEPCASRQYSENGHSLLSLSRIEFLKSPASARSSAICLTYPFWPGHSPMVSKTSAL